MLDKVRCKQDSSLPYNAGRTSFSACTRDLSSQTQQQHGKQPYQFQLSIAVNKDTASKTWAPQQKKVELFEMNNLRGKQYSASSASSSGSSLHGCPGDPGKGHTVSSTSFCHQLHPKLRRQTLGYNLCWQCLDDQADIRSLSGSLLHARSLVHASHGQLLADPHPNPHLNQKLSGNPVTCCLHHGACGSATVSFQVLQRFLCKPPGQHRHCCAAYDDMRQCAASSDSLGQQVMIV